MIEPRDYQAAAVARVENGLARSRSVLLVSPTGSGKGSMGVLLAQRAIERNASVLWLAHRRELVADTSARLAELGIRDQGVLLSGARRGNPHAPVQVGSIQTLLACGERPRADLIVFDEAHHVAAPSYRGLRQAYPAATILGLTATPERADGVGLGDAFDELVLAATTAELTRRGFLVPCDVIAPAQRREHLALDPKEAIAKYAAGRRAIVFCASVPHARKVAIEAGGVCVEGKLHRAKRATALAAFARGDIRVLTNVYCLTEGWDCPEAEVCILARGCSSASMYLQMVGRVLRISRGKTRALLVDLRGAVHEHGMPDDERTYSLSGRPIRANSEALPTLTRCTNCLALFRAQGKCPRCGAILPPPILPKVSPTALAKVTQLVTREEKQAYYDQLCAQRRAHGYAQGWISHRFRGRFGHWPRGFEESFTPRSNGQDSGKPHSTGNHGGARC